MKDTFYILFNDSTIIADESIISKMIAYFGQRGIYNEVTTDDNNLFRTTYQTNKFDILSIVYPKIGKVLKIVSTHKTNSDSILSCFLVVVKDYLTHHLNVKYYDIEVLDEENFNQIKNTHRSRFISRKTMCMFLEENKLETIPLELNVITKGQILIKRGFINNSLFDTDEYAWFSFAKKLDYDDWDITSANFAPLTYEEFENEISQFAKFWDINIGDYKISSKDDTISILRITKDWNANAYLIKTKKKMEFIGTDVWTG